MPPSTLKVSSNIGLLLLAFLREKRLLRFLALKVLRKAQKCHSIKYVLILDKFCFMTYPKEMPVSTLKLQFLDLRIS